MGGKAQSSADSGIADRHLLSSWKQIANFLHHEVRTVQRWEVSRGLPVHRVPGSSRSPVHAYTDELAGWMVSAKNRRKAADSDEIFLQTFMKAPQPMWLLDDDRRYREINEAACRMLGACRSELLDQQVDVFAHDSERAGIGALWRRFIESETLSGEFCFVSIGGEIIITSYRARAHVLPGLHLGLLREVLRLDPSCTHHQVLDYMKPVSQLVHDVHNAVQVLRDFEYLPEAMRTRAVADSADRIARIITVLLARIENGGSNRAVRHIRPMKRLA